MSRPRLDPEEFAPEIAPQMLLALIELCAEFGVAPMRICSGLGFGTEDLLAGMLVSVRQAWRIIRRSLQMTGHADLGLELGLRENLSHFGLPGFAMSTARNFGEAVNIGLRYQGQTGGLTDTSLQVDGNQVVFTTKARMRDDSVQPFLIEEVFSSVQTITRILVGPHMRMQSVELAYPAPEHARRYRELFDCPVRFGSTRNAMVIESRWLDAPIATHSPVMEAQLRAMLEQREIAQAVPEAKAAVEQVLKRPGSATLSIEEVARALELSVRTLRRRLQEAGTSFRSISDCVRAEAAQQLLREERVTVAEASERLGFSDARAFRRAFKRWLGQAPGEVRQQAAPIK
ncbi:AraC family transcriptional regulator [Lysobacter sp. CA199]|uniref:AraC family transcriptional regulator n=1 Tax=Lysobacter sp. CA199 TaxID=3455608 RepID=UPI003F8D330B